MPGNNKWIFLIHIETPEISLLTWLLECFLYRDTFKNCSRRHQQYIQASSRIIIVSKHNILKTNIYLIISDWQFINYYYLIVFQLNIFYKESIWNHHDFIIWIVLYGEILIDSAGCSFFIYELQIWIIELLCNNILNFIKISWHSFLLYIYIYNYMILFIF